jgi:catalase
MLLGRSFAYNDAQRNRIGTNFHQLPVNRPRNGAPNTYMFDGQMTFEHSGAAAVYAPNSAGRGWADGAAALEESWAVDGDMVRSAYELHAEDDDFGQPGTLVREVMDDAQRDRLIEQVSGSLLGGVRGETLERAFWYWQSIDAEVGKRIEAKVREGAAAEPVAGMGES